MDRPSLDPVDGAPAAPAEVVSDGREAAVPDDVFRRAFQSSFGLGMLLEADGGIRALSDAASAYYSSRGAALGTSIYDAPWWDEPDRVRESVHLARGGVLDRFYAPVTRDGARRTLLVDIQSVEGPADETWLLFEARDVTTLLASERQLHDLNAQLDRERALLRAVIDATPDALCAVDADGRLSVVNEAWRRTAAATLPETPSIGEDHAGTSPQSEAWRRALNGDAVRKRIAVRSAEAPRWFDASFVPVRTADGRVAGAALVGRDVTAEVDAARLHVALKGASAHPVTLHPDGRVEAPGLLDDVVSLDAIVHRMDAAETLRESFEQALAEPGSAVDLPFHLDGVPYRLRGRSIAVGEEVRISGVVYRGEALPVETAEDRWADLLANAGWGGAQPVELVPTAEAGGPPDATRVAGRVSALRRTALLDSPPSEAFDTLTRLVSESLGVPVSLISLVDEDRQFFKSQVGLGGAVADARETPLTHSFCQHVANERRPLVVADARQSTRLAGNPAIDDLDVVAYLGVPVAAPDGHVIGALCAIDHEPHDWTEDDVRALSSLAEVVTAEVAAHSPNSPDRL
ncbi:GAF domain-containing protein [Rubrivirga marina]|uniref:GAF domain-containing protein n=1 Tax=Rubrivirga marina TaxID=1196024 RepID=A0A271J1T7_9BACT|nr:GAF domain-containing protein [Rubrivirga marina]PAP77476.1 hypothetical protein BSZ37_14035 [Rubrivirga marina]